MVSSASKLWTLSSLMRHAHTHTPQHPRDGVPQGHTAGRTQQAGLGRLLSQGPQAYMRPSPPWWGLVPLALLTGCGRLRASIHSWYLHLNSTFLWPVKVADVLASDTHRFYSMPS